MLYKKRFIVLQISLTNKTIFMFYAHSQNTVKFENKSVMNLLPEKIK